MEPLTEEELQADLDELCLSLKQKRKLGLLDKNTISVVCAKRKNERTIEASLTAQDLSDRLFFKELEETIAYGRDRQAFRRSSADTLAACMFSVARPLRSQQEDGPFMRNKHLDFSMIHESSFYIFKGAFVQEISGVYDGAWRSMFNSNSTSIFNEEGNKRQRNKRVQCKFSLFEVPSENTTVNVALRSIYRRLQELLPSHHSEVWTLILSKSGTSLQDPHCDYTINPAEERRRQQEGYQLETTSFSLLIPTSDGANFVVWDAKEGDKEAKIIVIQKGDALILRDDCIHSGGYYKYEHFARLHVYLTCQSVPSIGTDTNIVKGLLSLEKKRQLEGEIKQKLGW